MTAFNIDSVLIKKKTACKTLWILTGAFLYLFFFYCQDLIILGLFYVTIIMLKPLEWRSTLICSIPMSGIAAPVWLMWTVCVSVQTGIFTATMLLVFNSLSSLYFSVKNSNMFWTERMRVCVFRSVCVLVCVRMWFLSGLTRCSRISLSSWVFA